MTTWVSADNRSVAQKLAAGVVGIGHVPKHVAFVMDGNRRFARGQKKEVKHGHKSGFLKLREVIRWCMDMGISEITVYAFSIYNFERDPEELKGLLEVIKGPFAAVLKERQKGINDGIRYQIVGDLSLIPPDMMDVMQKVMDISKNDVKFNVNVAFAYSGRREITNGLKRLVGEMRDKKIGPNDVNEFLFQNYMQIYPPTKLDLFVRTGESRLSDFLLWETDDKAVISFCEVLWPDYSYWNFLGSVFDYQGNII
ncbi:hypothetical protein Ocin01_17687 [Orchesella cincta]|uniref:Alkyl transferase n=1 Tax=Orchesella cincta TaxID=48709 RepID=A0A1D2M7P1_ORCCI|nr:hypothetical protein Ocin01_17687 [Orchesella cincta]